MKISVVVPAYNAGTTIAGQLEALGSQQCGEKWEVIVVDDCSTDDTLAVVKSYGRELPHLRIGTASHRRGAGAARNQGAALANGEALVFCDADDVVGAGWLRAIADALSDAPFVASRFETKKLNTGAVQRYVGHHPQEEGLQRLWYPPYLSHAGGCGLGVWKRVHDAVGGFDPSWPRLMDTDYCVRVQRSGHQLRFVRDAVIHIRFPDARRRVFWQGRLWAKYNTRLYKRYRTEEMRIAQPWKWYVLECVRLLRCRPSLGNRTQQAEWLFHLGWQAGLLEGSLAFRAAPAVFAPVAARIGFQHEDR